MFLLGDGIAPDFNKYERFLLDNNCFNKDLVGLFPINFKYSKKVKSLCPSNNTVYSNFNLNDFFELFFYIFTLYGGSIINKRMFDEIIRKSLFEKYKFRKLKFSVCIGNPIEKSYDKMIEKYNGRIVGTYLKDAKLFDGEYCDRKVYEIFREDYLKSISVDGGK